jgi:outer membrane protein TolC
MKEVEDAMDLDRELGVQIGALHTSLQESAKSSLYYEQRYRQGLDTIQSLLIAKEQEMAVKIRFNQLKAERLINRIQLALILGVGIEKEPSIKLTLEELVQL